VAVSFGSSMEANVLPPISFAFLFEPYKKETALRAASALVLRLNVGLCLYSFDGQLFLISNKNMTPTPIAQHHDAKASNEDRKRSRLWNGGLAGPR
jgi:hypothetical protein